MRVQHLAAIFAAFLAVVCSGRASALSLVVNVAGTGGQVGDTGIGGPAASAKLNGPCGVRFDTSGNLYFTDLNNAAVKKVDKTTGTISVVAGTNGSPGFSGDGGLATNAQLNGCVNLAFDVQGNLYICDEFNQRIREVSAAGTITTVAGTGNQTFGGEGSPPLSASFNNPAAIAFDTTGRLIVSDLGNNRVRRIDFTHNTVVTIAGTGQQGFSGDGQTAVDAQLFDPTSVVVVTSGEFYFLDAGNQRIRMVDTAGTIHTVAGNGTMGFSGDDGPATQAELALEQNGGCLAGLTVDSAGNLYLGDGLNNRLRVVNSAGTISTLAGTGVGGYNGNYQPVSAVELNGPVGLAFDPQGDLVFADFNNFLVRKILFNTNLTIPIAQNAAYTISANSSLAILLTATDSNSADTLTFSITAPPLNGALTGTAPNLTYTPFIGFTGTDSFAFTASNVVTTSNPATVSIAVTGSVPSITSLTITPAQPFVGQIVLGTAAATLSGGGTVSFSWNFGDGSAPVSSANVTHIYTAANTYTVTVTATSPDNLSSVRTQSVTVLPAFVEPVATAKLMLAMTKPLASSLSVKVAPVVIPSGLTISSLANASATLALAGGPPYVLMTLSKSGQGKIGGLGSFQVNFKKKTFTFKIDKEPNLNTWISALPGFSYTAPVGKSKPTGSFNITVPALITLKLNGTTYAFVATMTLQCTQKGTMIKGSEVKVD